MLVELSHDDLVRLVEGLNPSFDVTDDVLIKRLGEYDRPAFGGGHEEERWYWRESSLKKLTEQQLADVHAIIRGRKAKTLDTGEIRDLPPRPPAYIRLGLELKSTCMRYREGSDDYYIDNGCWSIDYKFEFGKMISVFTENPYSDFEYLNNIEMFPITKEEYKKAAGQYYSEW